jgi:hypothetical protein
VSGLAFGIHSDGTGLGFGETLVGSILRFVIAFEIIPKVLPFDLESLEDTSVTLAAKV